MFKDKLIVITAGLIFGLIIAFGIFLYQNYYTQNPKEAAKIIETPVTDTKSNPAPTIDSTEDFLNITTPEDDFQTLEQTVLISGKTKANRKLLISANIDEQVTVSQDDGSFSVSVKLDEGANEIAIIPLDNESLTKTKIITRTTE